MADSAVILTAITTSPLLLAQVVLLLLGWRQRNTTRSIERSLGPENGESLHQIMERIDAFQVYQRQRNHDIINVLVGLQYITLELAVKEGIPVGDVLDKFSKKYVGAVEDDL